MSALGGIFKFDPSDRVSGQELLQLAEGIDRVGPDGGGECLDRNLGMVYRAFHTTPESHSETQPLVRDQCILTWDGRLDNRKEIRAKLGRADIGTPTDLELVFAAYQEWGARGFAALIGDWAIALWDGRKQQLLLARDYIGVRRLFYRLDDRGIAWCSILEPLVLTSPGKLHLDFDYLASCIYPRPPIDSSPYREIEAVLPSHWVSFELGGGKATERYWALNPQSRIRYSSDADYEHHFREVFRAAIDRRLRADRTVLAELSGGIDSSSIVSMADQIRSDSPGVSIETLSYYDTEEPSGDERPYFSLVERQRGRSGHHIAKARFAQQTREDALKTLPGDNCKAAPGYFATSIRWAAVIDQIRRAVGARVILSGLGGDEILGGVQYEAPELVDHLVSGRLASFALSLFQWSLARKKTIFELLADTGELLRAAQDPNSLIAEVDKPFSWARLQPLRHHQSLPAFANWCELSAAQLTMEWVRYNLASQLGCTEPTPVGCEEKRYPYLDRELFVYLASIPRTEILRAGARRSLMRRALRGIVPDGVLDRKTKWFGIRGAAAMLSHQARVVEALFKEKWLSDGIVVEQQLVEKSIARIEQGEPIEARPLLCAIAIEQWLRCQFERGSIDLSPADVSGGQRSFSREPVSQALVTHRGN